ncbi:hypothetical protein SAMN05216326_10642 [Nitrosomonas marina]|uniref:Uncharacterized protein n=1 Tax=Nitrosomonas marina TaxID=917 RepID=A0A1I0A509_9PROT|nr:hypothetical protein SAMN05216326_10642 [Nitrosomonas marina]
MLFEQVFPSKLQNNNQHRSNRAIPALAKIAFSAFVIAKAWQIFLVKRYY